jgi:hypothetical protein
LRLNPNKVTLLPYKDGHPIPQKADEEGGVTGANAKGARKISCLKIFSGSNGVRQPPDSHCEHGLIEN